MADTKFVSGVAKLQRRIATIRATLSLPVMTEEIGQLLLRRTLARFDAEVDPDNKPWKPLSSETLRRRNRAGGKPGAPILVQTQKMRNSIRLIRGSASGAVFTNTGAGVRIGITDPEQVDKARAHNYGTGNIPVRRLLGVAALDVKSVDSLLRRRAVKLGIA